jgi:uncharacterized protein YbbK (DUF523 family)
VVVSKCLGFAHCRYDGGIVTDTFVASLKSQARLLPVCPELELGLGVPREPLRVIQDGGKLSLVQTGTGIDLTAPMESFCSSFLVSLSEPDGFILKTKSPSCGIRDVKQYASIDAPHPLGKGCGLFAREVLNRFPHLAIEDEAGLVEEAVRQHFLLKIQTLARFRQTKRAGTLDALRAFDADNSLLLQACDQNLLHRLRRLVTGDNEGNLDELFAKYQKMLFRVLSRP